jgi:hypothetical protein
MSEAVDCLCKLLSDSGAVVTFDPERDFTLPCFLCGSTTEQRTLIDLQFEGGVVLTRPFCPTCAPHAPEVTEREISKRTVARLFEQLGAALQELDEARSVTQAAVDWVNDMGECHFCDYTEKRGTHDETCPLYELTFY